VLWYKGWLETRSRFLTCLIIVTGFCAVFIHYTQGYVRPEWRKDFHRLMLVTHQYLVIIWIISVVLLGMGGLVREKANGSSSLTLSLPVSRAHLLGVRIAIGVLEAITLGVVPWVAIFLVSSAGGMPIQFQQARFYVLLLVSGGLVYFAMAVLVSSLLEGEYTAPAVAFGLVFLTMILFDLWLRDLNLWRFVSGDFYLDRNTYLLSGPFPWKGTVACLGVAALMLIASVKVLEEREF
jgi:ABC-2 type transport system permease protein